MIPADDAIHLVAADWHAASEGDAFDWDAFTSWLEADPRHASAYNEIALTDALLRDHAPDLAARLGPEAPDTVVAFAPRRRWPLWAGAAVAAATVAIVAVPRFAQPEAQIYTTEAGARTLALNDGSTIVLAPRSRLEIAGRTQADMKLSGGAWFDIRHDPARNLAIVVGDETIRDIGTAFDVRNTADGLRVAVTEGALSVASETLDKPIRLRAGRALALDRRTHTAQVSALAPGSAGDWRKGRLTYEQAPLRLVVDDLARYAGITIGIDKAVADRRFSGTLMIGDGKQAARDLSQLMGLALVARPDGYRLRQPER
ncbi:iron dicitrate transport regulator FecR [Novosphingobium sp. Gsoil 351]|nr:iron dicitrate transport regulator FecR [Novosphingobium sp. Gsoil 351]